MKQIVAKFELLPPADYRFLCDIYGNGSILENNEDATEKYMYGTTLVEGANITLTAKPDTYWEFKGWYKSSGDDLISTDVTYTFELTDHTSVYAMFEEKPTGLKLDAHNAGFTYNDNGELVTTIYQMGNEIKSNIDYVGVYATYSSLDKQDDYLTLDEDYTRDLGGLDFSKTFY